MSSFSQQQNDLPQHIKKTHNTNRVSVERVASGTGLVNVYNFLAEAFPERVDKTVHDGKMKIKERSQAQIVARSPGTSRK